MNKQQLVSALSIKSEISKKDAEKHITNLFNIIMETTASGEGVKIVSFGGFEKKPTKGTSGIIRFGDRKGQKWVSEDSYRVSFKAGKSFLDAVKGIVAE